MEWARRHALRAPVGWKRTVAWVVFGGVSIGTIGMLYYFAFVAAFWVYIAAVGLICIVWFSLTAWYLLVVGLVVALLRGPRVYGGVQRRW